MHRRLGSQSRHGGSGLETARCSGQLAQSVPACLPAPLPSAEADAAVANRRAPQPGPPPGWSLQPPREKPSSLRAPARTPGALDPPPNREGPCLPLAPVLSPCNSSPCPAPGWKLPAHPGRGQNPCSFQLQPSHQSRWTHIDCTGTLSHKDTSSRPRYASI